MGTMLYGIIPSDAIATALPMPIISTTPSEVGMLEPSIDSKRRELIALVGRDATGKHTYLEQYYQKLGVAEYMPLASMRCVEQNGIHPHEQYDYLQTLRSSKLLSLPDTFMFVTHSPYILDAMGWEQAHNIILFHWNHRTNRYYRGTMLSHPDYMWSMGSLTPGEFWDAEGENWLENYGEDVTATISP